MAGLWRNDPRTPEGKYPIVLRRDGTPVESRYFVLILHDPAASPALRAYADAAERLGYDMNFVGDVRSLANQAAALANPEVSDPDAPPHRVDSLEILAWARSIGCPGA